MTRDRVKELAATERAAIQRHISKTGRTRGRDGYRYRVVPAHGCVCWPEDLSDDALPEATVYVERKCFYETRYAGQDRVRGYWRTVRKFNVDMLQLRGLKQIPPEANA